MIIITILSWWKTSSVWPIDRILTGTTPLGQSGPGSNSNEEVLHTTQGFKIGA